MLPGPRVGQGVVVLGPAPVPGLATPAASLEAATLLHAAGHVVLRARHPKDAALHQVEQMTEVHVRLVEQGDFAVLQVGAHFSRAAIVVVLGRVDDRERRQV